MRATRRGAGRWTRWSTIATLVFVAGSIGSVAAARAVARSDGLRHDRAFASSANVVASTLDLALQREADLIVDTAGFVAGDPTVVDESFVAWTTSIHAFERYPELLSVSYYVVADPAGSPDGPCVLRGQRSRRGSSVAPAADDVCATGSASTFIRARDTGLSTYTTPSNTSSSTLTVVTPVFGTSVAPQTLAERRTGFVGWIEIRIVPDVVLGQALAGRNDLAVTMRYDDATSDVRLARGAPNTSTEQMSADVEGGWHVTVGGISPDQGLTSNGKSLGLWIGGIAISALLSALILVLADGRKRAWSVANTQTDELHRQALHDSLTSLPNRTLIGDRVRQMLLRGRRTGTEGAALYVDVDGFKDVNDALGHAAGDHLLQAVATRLTENLREADTIGRMGGDEFVVLVEGGEGHEPAAAVASRVQEVMHEPFDIPEAPGLISVTTSIGIAIGDRDNPIDLLRDADVAMSQAKAAGKDRVETFDEAHQATIDARHTVQFDLRSALDADQFRLHYQSVHRLDDMALIGAEALIRWQHPKRGLIRPDEFIPLLESSGHIVEVGRWVLHEACAHAVRWRNLGHDLTVAVNVSARQLDRDSIVADVRHALDRSGLAADHLIIEVTESALMSDVETTARRLRQLKDLGVQIAIDDFGTGYASLTYLQRFPVDCIKIDRSFTATIGDSPDSDRLVRALVQLGQNLGLDTLAEGIETEAQLDFLRAEGVGEAQGFYMSKPQPIAVFEARLAGPGSYSPARTAKPFEGSTLAFSQLLPG